VAPLLALLTAVGATAPAEAQTSTVRGVVVAADTREPVVEALVILAGTSHSALTNESGQFLIEGVRPATYDLRVSHIAFGERTVEIEVVASEPTSIRITLSTTAIVLEAVDVEVFTQEEVQARAAGFRRNLVTRDQIALSENTNLTMADVLRLHFPTVRLRRSENIVGGDTCIELRTIRTIGRNSPCLSPAVYLDGVPVMNPTSLYQTLDPRIIESMEVVPAAEAGARFGTGALYGALLIETRRPGAADPEERERQLVRGPRAFDWSMERSTHPSARSFLFAFVGNAAGLALGIAAANECIGTRAPSNDRIIAKCDTWPTFGAAAAALALPALGGGFGSWLGGRTQQSRGKLVASAVGGTMALVPGYALIISSRRDDSSGLYWLGTALVAVGVPLVTTLSDYLFRSLRQGETGGR